MTILDSYKKNKKKHLLKEFTGGESAATFVGGAGSFIDTKFAGPYHPDFGEIKKQLKKQVNFDIIKRMWTDKITPKSDIDFEEIDWKYEYDKYVKEDNSKFKSNDENKMQYVDIDIDYDKITDNKEENKKFINKTNNWKSIYDDKKY